MTSLNPHDVIASLNDVGVPAIPTKQGEKEPHVKAFNSYRENPPSAEPMATWRKRFPDCGVAVVMGQVVVRPDGTEARLIGIDSDHQGFNALVIHRVLRPYHIALRVTGPDGRSFSSVEWFKATPELVEQAIKQVLA